MFIKVVKSPRNRKFVYLVEGYRDQEHRVRHRTIKCFGALDELEKDDPDILKKLRENVVNYNVDKVEDLILNKTTNNDTMSVPVNYGYFFIERLFMQLNIPRRLSTYQNTIKYLVINRLLNINNEDINYFETFNITKEHISNLSTQLTIENNPIILSRDKPILSKIEIKEIDNKLLWVLIDENEIPIRFYQVDNEKKLKREIKKKYNIEELIFESNNDFLPISKDEDTSYMIWFISYVILKMLKKKTDNELTTIELLKSLSEAQMILIKRGLYLIWGQKDSFKKILNSFNVKFDLKYAKAEEIREFKRSIRGVMYNEKDNKES